MKNNIMFHNNSKQKDTLILSVYLILFITMGLFLIYKQPFGNPPDEYNRFLIPQYILENGHLPNGYDSEIRIYGYGFSYAFQPILPYIIQGYAMKLVSLVTNDFAALLFTARLVNLFFGIITAIFTHKISNILFPQTKFCYLFSAVAIFLPQSIFLHTYVNTDSCCMMSISIIVYALLKGIKNGFHRKTNILLSIGIIFCALSYYNAYGYILSAILLFIASFIQYNKDDKQLFSIQWKQLFSSGLFISAIVLLGISWWFIRSAILYNGDFLGLSARQECAKLYALPEYHPDTRITWETQGFSLIDMLKQSDFINLSTVSFIAMYGAMAIPTNIWIYRFYKLLFGMGFILFLLFFKQNQSHNTPSNRIYANYFFYINMAVCGIIPIALSAIYSYNTDYQPQGRYILPALIPLCLFAIKGLEFFFQFISSKKPARKHVISHFLTGFIAFLIMIIILSLLITIFGYASPYYTANPIAP